MQRRYDKGCIIFYSGESSQYLHILVRGTVKLYKHNANADELVLHYFKNQSLLGEMATFEGINYPANAIAETLCEIWTIKKEDFVLLLESNAALGLQIITSMGMKIKMLENSIDLNISKNSMQRVASLLLNSLEMFAEHSRIKISAILNMTPETLSRRIQTLSRWSYRTSRQRNQYQKSRETSKVSRLIVTATEFLFDLFICHGDVPLRFPDNFHRCVLCFWQFS